MVILGDPNTKMNVPAKAYQVYFAATPHLDKDHDNYPAESYWCLKLWNIITFKIIPNDIAHLAALLIILSQAVRRRSYIYGSPETKYFVSYRTGGTQAKGSAFEQAGALKIKKS